MSDADRIRALEEKSMELERLVEALDEIVRGTSGRLDRLERELERVRTLATEVAQESESEEA